MPPDYTVELDLKTRGGDRVVEIFINLPARRVTAPTVANAYRNRPTRFIPVVRFQWVNCSHGQECR